MGEWRKLPGLVASGNCRGGLWCNGVAPDAKGVARTTCGFVVLANGPQSFSTFSYVFKVFLFKSVVSFKKKTIA
jgi:hypothetical protein